MESSSLGNHTDPHPIPVYIAPVVDQTREITLVELWRMIVRQKAIVLFSILSFLLLALAYSFLSKPLYKANIDLLPPKHQMIQGLLVEYQNLRVIDPDRYAPDFVFDAFLGNLRSLALRREYFENRGLIKHYATDKSADGVNPDRIFDELFNKRLQVQIDRQNASFVTASFTDGDPQLAVRWLDEFIDLANRRTVDQLAGGVNAAIQSQIQQISRELDSKLKLAKQRRLDSIVALREALRIAEALGIRDSSLFSNDALFSKDMQKSISGLAVNTAETPLYMRGSEALRTEMSVLEARKSDEPFIEGFRDRQERLALLQAISIDTDALSAVTRDSNAKIPYRPEGPGKLLVISLALVAGIMVGIILAFVRGVISGAKV